jgi:methylated-DNA-protein-cysteine methyltransferase related protein
MGGTPAQLSSPRASAVLDRIRRVPEGFVTTYGDLCPEAPRFAGYVLSRTDDPCVPWQRIVRADGSLAKGDPQRRLLEAEGVPFRGGRVDMDVAWIPGDDLG